MSQINPLKLSNWSIGLACTFLLIAQSVEAKDKKPKEEKDQRFFLGHVVSVGEGEMIVESGGKQVTLRFDKNAFKPKFVGFKGLGKSPSMPEVGHNIKAGFNAELIIKSGLFSPGFPELKTIENRHKLSAKELFDKADENQNGKVDYLEYATWIFQSVKHLPDKFATRLDANGDDTLDLKEFEAALELLSWYRISRKTPAEWIAFEDKNNSGELEIEETKSLVIVGHSGDVEAKRIRTFSKLDTDKSGGLSAKEFEPEYQEAITSKN